MLGATELEDGSRMRRFRNILYVFEKSVEHNASVDRALDLARRNGATLTFARLVEEESPQPDPELEELVAGNRGDGAELRSLLLSGTPHVAVIRQVLRAGHDLVMKTASPDDDDFLSRLFGTLDTRLLELCPCPVWIDKPIPHTHYARIMACVDPFDVEEPELDVIILDLAASLAETERAILYVVHAWQIEGETQMRGRAFSESAEREIEGLVERERQRRQAALDALLEPLLDRGLRINAQLVKGEPEVVVPKKVKEFEIDLVVLGTHVTSHLAGLVLGNTAEAVLRQVECAVLAVKPPGFETPVRLDD